MGSGVIGNIAGGVVGGIFADRAATSMSRSQRQANQLNAEQFAQVSAQANPFITGGQDAFSALLSSFGIGTPSGQMDFSGFESSPDYLFAMQQGEQALQRRQSAQGNRLSPGAFKELLQFNQGLSSQNLGNYRSGLQGITGTGINALGMLTGAREGYTQRGMQGLTNLGDISASRQLAYGNILGDLFSGGGMGGGGGGSTYGGESGSTPWTPSGPLFGLD